MSEENAKITQDDINRLKDLQKRPQYIIPINCVSPNDYNENKMNKTRFEALKSHMRLKGQVGDVVIRPMDSGYDFSTPPTLNDKFIIVDGEHRWKGLGELGLDTVAVKIVDYSEAEARIATVGFNKIHGHTSEIGERKILQPIWQENKQNISSILLLEPFEEINNIPTHETMPEQEIPVEEYDDAIPANLADFSPAPIETKTTTTNTEKTEMTSQQLPSSDSASSDIPIQVQPPREKTFAVPYFIAESNYLEMKEFVAKYRVKHALESNNTAFYEIFKNGKDVAILREENNKLKAKIEKFEQEKQERKEKMEQRKKEKLKKELEKASQKDVKKSKKDVAKEQTVQ